VFGLVKLRDMARSSRGKDIGKRRAVQRAYYRRRKERACGRRGEGDGFSSQSEATARRQLFSASSSEEFAQEPTMRPDWEDLIQNPLSIPTPPPMNEGDSQEMLQEADSQESLQEADSHESLQEAVSHEALREGEAEEGNGDVQPQPRQWENLSKEEKLKPLCHFFAQFRSTTGCSKNGLQMIYDFFCKDEANYIVKLRDEHLLPYSYKTIERRSLRKCPAVFVDYWHRKELGCPIEVVREADSLPQKLRDNPQLYVRHVSYVKLEDVLAFLQSMPQHEASSCQLPLDQQMVTMSADGVASSLNGQVKFHIISLAFPWCGTPLPWFVWEFRSGQGPSTEELYGLPVDQLLASNCILAKVVADGLERKKLRGMVSTGGYYGCDWCPSRGEKHSINEGVHYPLSGIQPVRRSNDDVRQLVANPRALASESLREGVVAASPLLRLPYFDIIEDIPLDPMHAFHLGITGNIYRRLFCRANDVYKKREREDFVQAVNKLVVNTKLPSDFKRRTEPIDPARTKASVWQVLDSFIFVEVAEHIMHRPASVRKMILMYSFLIRAFYSSDWCWHHIKEAVDLQLLVSQFCSLYEKIFSKFACTYHLHIILHGITSRERHGPVWQHSAAKFEGLYSKLQRDYKKGTFNMAKQTLCGFYTGLPAGHSCFDKRIMSRVKAKATSKSDDSLICVGDKFYKVLSISEDDMAYSCFEVRVEKFQSQVIDLPFHLVGIYKLQQYNEEVEQVQATTVDGKAVTVGSCIMQCYKDWLMP